VRQMRDGQTWSVRDGRWGVVVLVGIRLIGLGGLVLGWHRGPERWWRRMMLGWPELLVPEGVQQEQQHQNRHRDTEQAALGDGLGFEERFVEGRPQPEPLSEEVICRRKSSGPCCSPMTYRRDVE